MDFSACFADKCAKGHIEMSGLCLSTVNAVGIKGILDEKCFDQLSLLGDRALDVRFGRWLRDEVQVGVRWQVRVGLEELLGHPSGLVMFRKFDRSNRHHGL